MSKEKTPIKAEEYSIEEHIKALLVLRGFSKEYILNNRGLIGAVIEDMEEYAQAKVLEALEMEFSKVEISMFDEDRSSDYIEQGKFYYETEVKPKYE